jgi:vitamin B12 transporter
MAGLRADRIDPDISRRSHDAGLRFELAPGHALRAHWSEGFKPPSFFALADPIVGNDALRPERSRSREVGWEARGAGGSMQLTAFDSRVRDLVDFDAETFRMVNRAGARMRGAELSAVLEAQLGRLEASYTYTDARLQGTESRLRNRPRHRASLALAKSWGAWTARAAAVHVGQTFDFSVPTGEATVPGHTVVDMSFGWRGAKWSVAFSIDNALDREYESFVGFRAPGRRARIKASFRL